MEFILKLFKISDDGDIFKLISGFLRFAMTKLLCN